MPTIDLDQLTLYRAETFRLPPAKRIATPEAALEWVNRRGFVYFWPIKGIDFPSLWTAVAGERVVADAHDDPGHVTWGWKDSALGKRQWYYAKILRRKATMISLEIAPYFYALSDNYGSPEEDHIIAYQAGRLTLEAKQVYEAILDNGPLHTLDLRREARLTSKGSDSVFNRALEVLQADFKILPVGVAEAGAWRYAFIYDLTARHYPDLPEKARAIGEAEARQKLLELYFASVGAAQLRDVTRLFGWGNELTARALKRLVNGGQVTGGALRADKAGEWYALSSLVGQGV
jgi:hypothetical protein